MNAPARRSATRELGYIVRIAIAAAGPTLDATVEQRLGVAAYLLIVEDGNLLKAVPVGDAAGHGAGVRVVSLALAEEAGAILVGHMSPGIAATLRKNGVEIVTSCTGPVRETLQRYARGDLTSKEAPPGRDRVAALRKSVSQLASILPVLIGVMLLVGAFKALVSPEAVMSVFSGAAFFDALTGAGVGSVLAGNPINSYVIGETLLGMGVSLFAVAAFMLAWVTVGLVQLPAEIEALGSRFALTRTLAALCLTVPTALVVAALVGVLS